MAHNSVKFTDSLMPQAAVAEPGFADATMGDNGICIGRVGERWGRSACHKLSAQVTNDKGGIQCMD
jgi:hypothetical protein